MIYVFYGDDDFRAREALNQLRAELDRDGNLTHNTVRWNDQDIRGLKPADLRNACHTASFFAEDRLVILDGLMTRFSGARRRSASGKARRTSENSSEADAFIEVLTDLPPTTTVALIDERSSDRFTGAFEAMGKNAVVRQFPTLKGDGVRDWAKERIRSNGIKISTAASDRLLSLIDGSHIGELAQELDKLSTYADGRQIELNDVNEMVSSAIEYQRWDLTDAVVAGRGERALAVLSEMRDDRDFVPQILISALTRQLRQLMVAQAMLRDGAGTDQIGAQLGISGFPLKKTIDKASLFQADRLELAYRRLLETDVAVKTGVLNVNVALELLVADLAELARGRRRVAAR